MNKLLRNIKNLISIPLMSILLVIGYVDLFLRKSLLNLGIFEQPKPAGFKTPQDAVESEEANSGPDGRKEAFSELMSYFQGHSDDWIETFRFKLEEIESVEPFRYADPHLYAVLKPTRGENIQRIGNIIREIDPEIYQHSIEEIRELKQMRDFKNGQ